MWQFRSAYVRGSGYLGSLSASAHESDILRSAQRVWWVACQGWDQACPGAVRLLATRASFNLPARCMSGPRSFPTRDPYWGGSSNLERPAPVTVYSTLASGG